MGRRALGGLGFLALLASAALAAAVPEEPRVRADAGGRLWLSRLPALLAEPGIRRHLESGLTTSLVFQGGPSAAPKVGGARVDVRLELWDEVYLVAVADAGGRIVRSRQGSFEELEQWWSQVELMLIDDAEAIAASAESARVSLAVVPFSQAELLDTQRWLAESIGQSRGGAGGGGGGATSAVSALIATSMQRRAVRTASWSVPLERRHEP